MNSAELSVLMTISPTRVHPDVLRAMATQTPTADDPAFIAAFGRALQSVRELLGARACQPFIIPGTGTLGMEALIANWLEPGARVLVVSTGYWGDRFAEVARRHGVAVHHAQVAPGQGPDYAALEAELATGAYKALAWTHVDSSTGVRVDCADMASLARRHCALSLVDGIAGAGAEPFDQDACDVDVYLTASPKALGVPAGLIVITAGERALESLARRAAPPLVYALDLTEWLPVMRLLENGQFGYFNTPALNLVMALAIGLERISEEGLERRWQRHARIAAGIHAGLDALDLRLVAAEEHRSNGLSTVWYPAGVGRELLAAVRAEGVILAGGHHPDIGPQTFRIGHLGWVSASDALATIGALERSLRRLGHGTGAEVGRGVAATQASLDAALRSLPGVLDPTI